MQKGLCILSNSTKVILIALLCLCQLAGYAQGLINNGAYIVTTNGSHLYINGSTGHFTNQSGGLVSNNTAGGTLTVFGNWINNAANSVFSNDGATVVLAGSTAQSVAGTNSTAFYNLTASGTGTKTFNRSSTVSRLVSVGASTTLNANSNLTLLATASDNASVGPLLSGASVTNNVIVQSYLTGGNSSYRAWRGMSSPINDALVSGDKTYKQLQSSLIVTGPGNTANGFDKGNSIAPNATTIKTYNESAALGSSQFTNLPSITQATTPGKGFFLYFRGNRTANYDASGTYATGSKVAGPTYATPENVLVSYTGPINQGTVNVNLSYTDNGDSDVFTGSNLVGNPYPSVIDWHAVQSASTANIDSKIYVIKQDGAFAIYNSSNGTSTNFGTRYIMPGQAFYVQALASGQTLTFTESCKDPYPSSGTVMRFLSRQGPDNLALNGAATQSAHVHPVIRMKAQNSLSIEESLVAFIDGATSNYDVKDDALYFGGNTISFSSKSADNKNLAINAFPVKEPTDVPLNIGTSKPGNLKIDFTEVSAAEYGQIFLTDAYAKKLEHVKEGSSYAFDIDNNDPQTYGSKRLKLSFRPNISLAGFEAEKIYSGVELKWPSTGINAKTFVIERATNGGEFALVGSVEAYNDRKSYIFNDPSPEVGINQYRIKIVEPEGLFSYSNSVSLEYNLTATDPGFKIYPNPVQNELNVIYKRPVEAATVEIYTLGGQQIKSVKVNSNSAPLNVSTLKAGVYVVKVIDGNHVEIGTEKFIKE
jgi:trimeric autotransporter adhesin